MNHWVEKLGVNPQVLSLLQMSSGVVGWGMKKVFESTPALEQSQVYLLAKCVYFTSIACFTWTAQRHG